MRIVTWNVNSLRARLDHVEQWIAQYSPDILMMQETKCEDDAFPTDHFVNLGYESVHHGDGRWNGVAILSKLGIADARHGFSEPLPDGPDECRLISADCGGTRVFSVYVPNGREVDSDHYDYKLRFLAHLRRELDTMCSPSDRVVVGGDFNVAPEDRDVWDISKFDGMTHVSVRERAGLATIEDFGLHDVMRERHPDEVGPFSWWDYRVGNFHKGFGMRIDLVLATDPVASAVTEAIVDREARKKSKSGTAPSDHAPVVVDVAS